MSELERCLVTGNPYGTDTVREDYHCPCKNCRASRLKPQEVPLGQPLKPFSETFSGLVYFADEGGGRWVGKSHALSKASQD